VINLKIEISSNHEDNTQKHLSKSNRFKFKILDGIKFKIEIEI